MNNLELAAQVLLGNRPAGHSLEDGFYVLDIQTSRSWEIKTSIFITLSEKNNYGQCIEICKGLKVSKAEWNSIIANAMDR